MASVSASWGQIKLVPSVGAPVRGWGKGSRRKSVWESRKGRMTPRVSAGVRVQTE
jgi:hypothetical protein